MACFLHVTLPPTAHFRAATLPHGRAKGKRRAPLLRLSADYGGVRFAAASRLYNDSCFKRRKPLRIGITYDLRTDYLAAGYSMEETAEFDSVETIDAIERTLGHLGHETQRIGRLEQLRLRLARGERWHMVFNIAEGLSGVDREARVPALLEACGVPCTFSGAPVLTAGLHKGTSKRMARLAGIPTADFEVVATPEGAEKCRLPMPLFVKPVAEGSSKGITAANVVADQQELVDRCGALLERYRQPVLLETYLPGREFTVGIVGTGERAKVLGVMEILHGPGAEAGGYTYANKANFSASVRYEMATDGTALRTGAMALQAWRSMGGRDAGRMDMRCDANGEPHFLEVNPLAGLHPESSDLPILCRLTGVRYEDLIGSILTSACRRLPRSLA